MKSQNNPWKTISRQKTYDNQWITVEEHKVINPGGEQGIYGKVHFKNKAIGIIPVDREWNTWLVGQYRYTLNEFSWEIPMGGGPLKEDILNSAKRELKEETGITARTWKEIMRIHTSNSVTDEEGHIFLAQDILHGDAEPEPAEGDLEVKKLSLEKAVKMVLDGEVTDAISIAGLLKVHFLLNTNQTLK